MAVKKDSHRCKLTAQLETFIMNTMHLTWFLLRNPFLATGLYTQYFPKNHHPACDRTGQNDCDCPIRQQHSCCFKSTCPSGFSEYPEYKAEYRARHELLTTMAGIEYDKQLSMICSCLLTPMATVRFKYGSRKLNALFGRKSLTT